MSNCVIVDEGSSFVKAQVIGDNTRFITFPSRVVNKKVQDMTTASLISDRCYLVDGSNLSVFPATDEPQTTSNGAEYQTSATNLVLVHDALRLLGFGGKNVELSVTLPIGLFFSGDGVNVDLINRKKEKLMSAISHVNGAELANITSVVVRPEGFSIAIDAMLDDEGNTKPEYSHVEKIIVVDIGGTTTDIALMSVDGQIEKFKSSRNAVFPLRDSISHKLINQFNLDDDVPVSVMDKILMTGLMGKHDVSAIVDQCAKDQAQGIIKDLTAFAGTMSAIDLLVIAGGGAYTIGKHVQDYFSQVNNIIPSEPEKSVMRGYDKFTVAQ